jgi:hypothetical protein
MHARSDAGGSPVVRLESETFCVRSGGRVAGDASGQQTVQSEQHREENKRSSGEK